VDVVALIMLCALVCTVPLILICGPIAPPSIVSIPNEPINPPAITQEEISIPSDIIDKEGYEIVYNEDIKNSLKEGIVERSIETMRKNGMGYEAIKKKMMESFSLDEETINGLLKH